MSALDVESPTAERALPLAIVIIKLLFSPFWDVGEFIPWFARALNNIAALRCRNRWLMRWRAWMRHVRIWDICQTLRLWFSTEIFNRRIQSEIHFGHCRNICQISETWVDLSCYRLTLSQQFHEVVGRIKSKIDCSSPYPKLRSFDVFTWAAALLHPSFDFRDMLVKASFHCTFQPVILYFKWMQWDCGSTCVFLIFSGGSSGKTSRSLT